ncbi:MAG: tRNA preQ1(34) S-adenosylmethionine ribosyltransferase-isomerase QueA [Candidatus Omnitrophica bacterium]|nr:tRNA preQ1(34) S-adenosylmethionine ribosyltransferase-isomerase QueA [Candidatus Omnitrophota bacterium]
MKLSNFDYNLPKELIAQYPAEKRDGSRLLVLHKDTGEIEHRVFKDIIEYFNPGDLLILNNTKVLPAQIIGRKETGGKVEALVLNAGKGSGEKGEYEVLLKPARGCNVGSKIIFGSGELNAEVARIENGRRFLKFDCNGNLQKVLNELGEMPLPPYIKREATDFDSERYQTVYAVKSGAVAAPTAGLHFTKKLLEDISKKGVGLEYVTLHVGYGTFKPVSSEYIKEHKMEKEYFEIDKAVADKLKDRKGKLVAVGTTSCRVLETTLRDGSRANRKSVPQGTGLALAPEPSLSGWTDLFIYPGYKFEIVDALLTNFHLPKTTLLMLVAAFCGRELLFKAYEEAIKEKYRFYSYGDAMLII